jgi:ubiquinone/menaquinone biosynthesis C-methylase UbiE
MTTTAGRGCAAFEVPAEGYDRMMGRFLATLGPAFADAAGVAPGQRVLDVGCGPGGLTTELARRVGPGSVSAVDPSPPFLEACRARVPGVHAVLGVAEELPFPAGSFDATLACLVTGFMTDPAAGVAEMARVTVPGGIVAACFWDLARMPALQTFWHAAAAVEPALPSDIARPGSRAGELTGLLTKAGLREVRGTTLATSATYTGFDDWWAPFDAGVGPAGQYLAGLDGRARDAVRRACVRELGTPVGPFTLDATAWCACGVA